MANLTFKDIRYIRAALEHELEYLQTTIEQDNAGTLEPPLTDDEGSEMSDDSLFYSPLLAWFRQWEIQSVPLQVVPKDSSAEEKKDGIG